MMLWTPDRWWGDTEEAGFRPNWIGSSAYNSLNLPMSNEDDDQIDEEDDQIEPDDP